MVFAYIYYLLSWIPLSSNFLNRKSWEILMTFVCWQISTFVVKIIWLWKSSKILQELKSEFRTIDLHHSYLFAVMNDWSMFIVLPVSRLTSSKGQIISEAIFLGFNSSKKRTKYFQKFALATWAEVFCLFFGRIEKTKTSFRN